MGLFFKLVKHETQDGTISYHPRIPVTISYGNKSKRVLGVLDTGSDLIYIPKDMADYFQLRLSEKTYEAKTPNSVFKYKTANAYITLEKGHFLRKWNLRVIVPLEDTHNEIILGTPFLSLFRVYFDYEKNEIELKEITRKSK